MTFNDRRVVAVTPDDEGGLHCIDRHCRDSAYTFIIQESRNSIVICPFTEYLPICGQVYLLFCSGLH